MRDLTSRADTGIASARSGIRSLRKTSAIAVGALASLFWMGSLPVAVAQRAAAPVSSSDELRPLYANAMDVADGKRLAEATCSNCHGAEGISAIAEVPNLAGQRSAYLYRELRAYKSGARGNDAMNGTVKFLSNDAFVNVAAFYASLDPAQPAAVSAANADIDPVQAGKAAAAGCAGCHGETGLSKMPGVPSLAGLDPKYLAAIMAAYKSGERKNDIMKTMMAAVADTNASNIALFYALQNPARAQAAAGGATAVPSVSTPCAGCHGARGVSVNPATPSLAGQDAQYLAAALHAYQDGSRGEATMKGMAAGLDDATMKILAGFYATQPPPPSTVRKPLNTAQWVERCDRCHGVNGNSSDPRIPALAAQGAEYLEKVLGAYRTGARRSPEMAAMAGGLSENDVRNLAGYYARQKARAVVYVPIPPR